MSNEKSYFENIFIFICFVVTIILVWYYSQESQLKTGDLYVRDTISNAYTFNTGTQGEKIDWKQHLSVWNNWNTVIKKESWTIKPEDNQWLESMGSVQSGTVVYVKWFPEDSQATKIATYAYQISSWDIDFLATLKAENGWFDMYKQSDVVINWHREESYWLCQMMRIYHKEVDTKIFWESWEYQVETCYKKYKWWTKFYWFNVRHRYKKDFIIVNR